MLCSIVIPTRGRPGQLAGCLEALTALEYPRDQFEVIVVDDGGNTAIEPLRRFERSIDLSVISQAHSGPAAARNLGVARARGELLLFIDDDCRPAPSWLQRLVDRATENPGSAVGGRTLNGVERNLFSHASQLIVEVGYAQNNPDPGSASWFACNNLALPASGFRAIGGFDPRFRTAEDSELCDRWRMHGYRMVYALDAVVFHHHALGSRSFCRQHFQNGRGLFHYRSAYRRRRDARARIEPSYYLALAGAALQAERGMRRLGLLACVLLAQAVNAFGFLYEWQRQGRDGRPERSLHATSP